MRGYFQLEEVAPVQVKERTVRPLRVTGLGSRTARLDSGSGLSPFTGRDRELAELRRVLEIVVNGEGQVVGLAGDPGLGKSRLAWEFCRLAEDDAAVLEGRCRSYGAAIAYLPLFELVRNACGIAADDAPDLVATRIERKIKTLELDVSLAHYLRHAFGLPTGDPAAAALDPVAIRARTFEALRRLLVAEAGHRPLVVLIEDLHWIDQTSEEFLAGFVGELPSVPIMLLVTYRPGYSSPWPGKSFTSQLALRPLSSVASEKIVASILDAGGPAAAAAIAERGEGNPFFLEELARATRDQVADEEGGAVPQTVQQVLAARIDRLTAGQKAALQVAAVLGREFSLDLAEEVWDGDVPLEARLQELKGLEFLRERHGGPERIFVFTHALTREVAYDGMLEARRRELHGRAGASLEDSQASQRFEHAELLAYHYARSAVPARAIPYLAAAGARAKDRYANEEAIRLYRKALSIVGDLPAGSDRDRQELEILEAVAAPAQCQVRLCLPGAAADARAYGRPGRVAGPQGLDGRRPGPAVDVAVRPGTHRRCVPDSQPRAEHCRPRLQAEWPGTFRRRWLGAESREAGRGTAPPRACRRSGGQSGLADHRRQARPIRQGLGGTCPLAPGPRHRDPVRLPPGHQAGQVDRQSVLPGRGAGL